MRISSDGLLGAVVALLVPVAAGLIFMYSDVQKLKETKADKLEVAEVRSELGKQLALNTQAIKNLDTTLVQFNKFIHRALSQRGNNNEREDSRGPP